MKRYTLTSAQLERDPTRRGFLYNGLDVIATRRIADNLLARMDARTQRTYAFERAAQIPAFYMMNRGILVDEFERDKVVAAVKKEIKVVERRISDREDIKVVWDKLEKVTGACPTPTRKDGKHKWLRGVPDTPERTCEDCGVSRFTVAPFSPTSPDQVKHLLYDLLHAPIQRNKDGNVSVDDDALERIGLKRPKLAPLTEALRGHRKLAKQLSTLKAPLLNGRWMSSFNVGTAWTGRWSSSKGPEGHGGNSQNITERHRHIFVADPGYELWYADLKQAESNIVAHLAGDEAYIEAHKLGDVHTYVTRLVWTDLPWTWDLKLDKAVAKQLPDWDPVEGHDFRFQAKRIQHGSNYLLTPRGIAIIGHIPVAAASSAQQNYFKAFPHIRPWQRTIREDVRAQKALVSPLGISVKLFGRPWDEHTTKQGVSFKPQGTVAHIINIAAWRVSELEKDGLQLLAQVHDALLFQTPIGRRDLGFEACRRMRVPIDVEDHYGTVRRVAIEVEAAVGGNWGHKRPDNPNGIVEVDIPE